MSTLDDLGEEARLALPYEYVADNEDVRQPNVRDIQDPEIAATLIRAYLDSRIRAISHKADQRLGLMLSGGIDSILTGAVARSVGLEPYCVTVVAEDISSDDGPTAVAAAAVLGFEHEVNVLTSSEMLAEVGHCIDLLQCDEVWEVLSAVPIRAAFDSFAMAGVEGPVLTGSGADAIFAGGKRLRSPSLASVDADRELDELTKKEVFANFRRARLVPDFYERLLGPDHGRFVMLFQTAPAWHLARRFRASVLWGERQGKLYDKFALRLAAERLGLPDEVVWTQKSPLQRSSGMVASLGMAGRQALRNRPGATTYTDPLTEDDDLFIARMCLRFHRELTEDLGTVGLDPSEISSIPVSDG